MQEDVIQITNLTKHYKNFSALEDLNLTVKRGEVLGYLGPNGAGKTTTIRLMLGLIRPTKGQVLIEGMNAQKKKIEVHKNLAYVPGESNLWPSLTGEETLHLLAQIHGSVDQSYRKQLIKAFKFEPSKKVRTYSKGNRQKITLIAALASRAPLLILDEPTSGLDPLMEQVFRDAIREAKNNGQTVFLSSHILEEVESLCDRVAVIRRGKLIESGTLEELRHLSAVTVEATFGGTVPSVKHLAGISDVKISGKHLKCQVHGSIDELLKVVAAAKPITFFSREPSLEELFLSLYGENEKKA
jgi:ABC-2 type transport system ATP-binding protein